MIARIFVHWKTTVAGLSFTGVMGFLTQTYKPGMKWQAWALIAVPAVLGALAKDAGKAS